jgi:hypothetical protein
MDRYHTYVIGTHLGNVKGTKASDVKESVVRIRNSSSIAICFIMVTCMLQMMPTEKNEWVLDSLDSFQAHYP